MTPDEEARSHELTLRYGIDLPTLQQMYLDWSEDGVPKSVVEARYLRTRRHHGKLFSRLVREYLLIETQHPSPLRQRLTSLEAECQRLRDENRVLRTKLEDLRGLSASEEDG